MKNEALTNSSPKLQIEGRKWTRGEKRKDELVEISDRTSVGVRHDAHSAQLRFDFARIGRTTFLLRVHFLLTRHGLLAAERRVENVEIPAALLSEQFRGVKFQTEGKIRSRKNSTERKNARGNRFEIVGNVVGGVLKARNVTGNAVVTDHVLRTRPANVRHDVGRSTTSGDRRRWTTNARSIGKNRTGATRLTSERRRNFVFSN